MVTVNIPTPLRKLTGGESRVQAKGKDILSVVENLEAQFPGIRERLLDETGEIKRFINIYVNEDEIRSLQGKATPVSDGDRISIVPAMAGGYGLEVITDYAPAPETIPAQAARLDSSSVSKRPARQNG